MSCRTAPGRCVRIRIAFAAFELHILKRPGAEADYSEEEQRQAEVYFKAMSEADIDKLTRNIIAGLPGAEEGYTLDQFRARLAEYDHIDKAQLRENMADSCAPSCRYAKR